MAAAQTIRVEGARPRLVNVRWGRVSFTDESGGVSGMHRERLSDRSLNGFPGTHGTPWSHASCGTSGARRLTRTLCTFLHKERQIVTSSISRLSAFIAAAALFAAGCGSSSSDSTTSSSSPSDTASGTQMTGNGKLVAAAPIPSDLHCTDAIVWVNLASKAYHMSGDKFYGRSKRGEYECQSTAESKGYHLAGTAHHHTGSKTTDESPEPSST